MKILLIAGGWSTEREVSLTGGRVMEKALKSLGHEVTFCDLLENFDRILDLAGKHDFAMLNLHGTPGEDGLVQAMLESVHCPYLGAGPTGSFLSLNKAVTKQVLRHAGLPTADWEFLPTRPAPEWQTKLPFPVFAKSNLGGSSIHLGRAASRQELDALVKEIFDNGDSALIEPALTGKEATCAVLGEEALPPVLIDPLPPIISITRASTPMAVRVRSVPLPCPKTSSGKSRSTPSPPAGLSAWTVTAVWTSLSLLTEA